MKLTEFAFSESGPLSALGILLAHSNGRGSGDIDFKNSLIGSWAGDPVIVAGDYDDTLLFVPPEDVDACRLKTGIKEPNLYIVAHLLYEDISDKIIKVVCKAEIDHPWNALDANDRGWRSSTKWAILPEKEPVKPMGGIRGYEKYKKHAVTEKDALREELIALAKKCGLNPRDTLEQFQALFEILPAITQGPKL